MHAGSIRRTSIGFTLVELLVVIGIIAVLISILLPTLNKARQSAIQVQCLSNLRQFAVVNQMYLNQYNWHMPAWWGPNAASGSFTTFWSGLPEFRKALSIPILDPPKGYRAYVPRKWYCTNAVRGLTPSPNPGPDPETQQWYWPMHYSTGMNVHGVDEPVAANPDVLDPRAPQASLALGDKCIHGFRRSQVRRPAEKLHFVDAMYFAVNMYGSGVFPGWKGKVSSYEQLKERTDSGTLAGIGAYDANRTVAWRHNGGANAAFFDGHGEWLPKDKIYSRDASGNIVGNAKLWKVMD